MAKTDKPRAQTPAVEWRKFRVTWNGLNKICASVPADPEIVKAWLDSRKPTVRPPTGPSIDEINEEVLAHMSEEAAAASGQILIFQRDQGHCTMRAGTIKAHLKDCGRRLSSRMGQIQGEAAFSTKVINYVYPNPLQYWVPIRRPDGEIVTKHDGEMDRPITTRYGTALKRFEWIEPWRMDFELWVLAVSGVVPVGRDDLEKLMLYGGVHGYAGERGNGEGKYLATIEEVD